jgi:endonuclease/exonuclease/phosphatase family metal-dependent hydrolase
LAGEAHIRLLSYNIQTGVDTHYYRHYITRGWKSWLPHQNQLPNLNRVATLAREYDIVGLQEVDAGSLRSNFLDQTEYLARRAGFPGWYRQINRDLGPLGQHSNGLLSRYKAQRVEQHKLPGNLPGRGALLVVYGLPGQELAVCVAHLALGQRARRSQLCYLAELIQPFEHVVLMGDFNCSCLAPELENLMVKTGVRAPDCNEPSFPSWRPFRRLDHILVSDSLEVTGSEVVKFPLSDHLPIGVDIRLPLDFRWQP